MRPAADSALPGGPSHAPRKAQDPPDEPRAFCVDRVAVGAGSIRCEVRLAPGEPHLTSPELMRRGLVEFPNLALHACVNEAGPCFGDIMDRTPIPHLFEHLVIDLQARGSRDGGAVFVGTTEWTDRELGMARVEVSFKDDLAALRAIKEAAAFLDARLRGL